MKSRDSLRHACFEPVAGLGLVFDPTCPRDGVHKKHQCADCHFCQGCSESRCQTCRDSAAQQSGSSNASSGKLSVREQILLYEAINREME
jgi:hypothetical protein